MQTKTTGATHLFYINGTKCEIVIDSQCIRWRQVRAKEGGKERQINFAQIIGIKTKLDRKIKVYYAKENANRSANRLLKLEKVSIINTNGYHRNHHHNNHRHHHKHKALITDSSTDAHLETSATNLTLVPPMIKLSRKIEAALEIERQKRPKKLLIFVNPYGGKGKASHLYETQVRRLLELAAIETTVVMTKYANHARDTVEDPQFNVEEFGGIVCVGGDGMFAELMNGLLFRYNRDKILKAELQAVNYANPTNDCSIEPTSGNGTATKASSDSDPEQDEAAKESDNDKEFDQKIAALRGALGGIGRQFVSPPVPIGVIGAGSTDANSFGLIGTNDVITATLNIILSNQVKIDVCSIHSIQEDRPLRFVSTFVAYGYFGDVIRESEKLRWLGPSRYDVTGLNNLIKNRTYKGSVSILTSIQDGSPDDMAERCHINCAQCALSKVRRQCSALNQSDGRHLRLLEKTGSFVGVNAAVTACRCPQTKKGFSPSNHLANGCVDLILVRPCSRIQYVHYLLRTGWTKKSAFDLKYVEAYRCRQFEFVAQLDREKIICPSEPSSVASSASSSASKSNSLDSKQSSSNRAKSCTLSSWNVDGEIFDELSIRVKVNNQLLRVFGTGEPLTNIRQHEYHLRPHHDKVTAQADIQFKSKSELAGEMH